MPVGMAGRLADPGEVGTHILTWAGLSSRIRSCWGLGGSKAGWAMNGFRRVFITGASSGLGEGLARHYATEGAAVGLVARRAEVLGALAKDLEGNGAAVQVYTRDVADTAGMAEVVQDYLSAAGGFEQVGPIETISAFRAARLGEQAKIVLAQRAQDFFVDAIPIGKFVLEWVFGKRFHLLYYTPWEIHADGDQMEIRGQSAAEYHPWGGIPWQRRGN